MILLFAAVAESNLRWYVFSGKNLLDNGSEGKWVNQIMAKSSGRIYFQVGGGENKILRSGKIEVQKSFVHYQSVPFLFNIQSLF